MFLFLIFLTNSITAYGFYTNLLIRGRLNRHCHDSSISTASAVVPSVTESSLSLVFILISGLIFFLIFLGLLKGLIGLLLDQIGMYGLNLLIDLPRSLPRYQEKNLQRRPVVYDIGGWPIHPDTLERTIRVLPKRTQFCLNLIFFLAYPLAACVYVCALCCCIRNLTKSKENACFKHVDVVRLTSQDKKNNNNKSKAVYNEDHKEEEDTKYVIDAMHKSKESINTFRINIKTCQCSPGQ